MEVKVMISQPMRGKTNEQIKKERECLIKAIKASDGEYLDTVFDTVEDGTPLSYLSKSIKYLDTADMIWFMPGWEKSRGCRIEFECAKEYGKNIKCITEEEYDMLNSISNNAKQIKVKIKSHFDEKVNDEDLSLDDEIEKFRKDLEEMLNDFAEKRES